MFCHVDYKVLVAKTADPRRGVARERGDGAMSTGGRGPGGGGRGRKPTSGAPSTAPAPRASGSPSAPSPAPGADTKQRDRLVSSIRDIIPTLSETDAKNFVPKTIYAI